MKMIFWTFAYPTFGPNDWEDNLGLKQMKLSNRDFAKSF